MTDTMMPETGISDRQLTRRLGDALRALARVEAGRRPRAATLDAARATVAELQRELAARIGGGTFTAWDALGVSATPDVEKRSNGAGSVYEEKSRGRWVAEISVNGVRARKAAPTRQAAEAWLREARARAAEGMDARETTWTVGAWLDHCLRDIWPTAGLRPSTLANHRHGITTWWKPNVGGIKLRNLQVADVQRVITKMTREAGLSPNTVRINTACLIKALNEAERQRLVTANVAALTTRPRLDQRRPTGHLTPEEARRLLAACVDEPMGDAIALALLTGLRRGELLGLMWSRVDLDGPRPTARVEAQVTAMGGYEETTKTRSSKRTVVLGPEAAGVLRRRRDRQAFERRAAEDGWSETGLVFTDAVGQALRPDGFTKAVSRLTLRVLGRSVAPHGLRHTAATLMAAAGVPVRIAAERLGHDPALMVGTYVHGLSADHDRAAEAMDMLLTGEGRP